MFDFEKCFCCKLALFLFIFCNSKLLLVGTSCCGAYSEVYCNDGRTMFDACLDCTYPKRDNYWQLIKACGITECNTLGCNCECRRPIPETTENPNKTIQTTIKTMLTSSNPTTSNPSTSNTSTSNTSTSNQTIPKTSFQNIFSSTTQLSTAIFNPTNKSLQEPSINFNWIIIGMLAFMMLFLTFLTILVIFMFRKFSHEKRSHKISSNPDHTAEPNIYDQPIFSYSDLIDRVEESESYVTPSVEVGQRATPLEYMSMIKQEV